MNRAWRHTFPLTALFPSAIPIGSQRVRAICPDPKHVETHPSCVVNYDSTHGWKWHCFSCGADGDALDVLTGREGMTVRDALDLLGGVAAGPASTRERGMAVGAQASVPRDGGSNPPPSYVLVCDACRNETAEFSKRRYGRDGRAWTAGADLELATLPGWELSAGLQYFIGPKCIERIGA